MSICVACIYLYIYIDLSLYPNRSQPLNLWIFAQYLWLYRSVLIICIPEKSNHPRTPRRVKG